MATKTPPPLHAAATAAVRRGVEFYKGKKLLATKHWENRIKKKLQRRNDTSTDSRL